MNSPLFLKWSVIFLGLLLYWNVLAAELPGSIEEFNSPIGNSTRNKLFFLHNDLHTRINKSSAMFTLHTLDCQYGEKILIEKSIINKTCFNASNDVKILIHGYTEKGHSINSIVPIRLAYFRAKKNVNVIMVDWSIHSVDGNYVNSARHLDEVANYLATFIIYLERTTAFSNMTKIHMVGFSLGAHVAGLAGRGIEARTGQKVGRITGLDPAGPGFHALLVDSRVTINDADFLDFIHCDTDTFGGNFKGHANFYPNGGKKQPGCLSIFGILIGCGHRRAPQWYAESIMFPRKYIGCRCKDFQTFNENKCSCANRNDQAVLGEHCSSKSRGIFFLHVKEADYQYVLGVYPSIISLGFNNRGKINNQTVPNIPLEEVLPTIPSFNFTEIDVPAPSELALEEQEKKEVLEVYS